jgi:hypothetical protein
MLKWLVYLHCVSVGVCMEDIEEGGHTLRKHR